MGKKRIRGMVNLSRGNIFLIVGFAAEMAEEREKQRNGGERWSKEKGKGVARRYQEKRNCLVVDKVVI